MSSLTLNKKQIIRAFEALSSALYQGNVKGPVDLVVAGGACYVLWGIRPDTRDINWTHREAGVRQTIAFATRQTKWGPCFENSRILEAFDTDKAENLYRLCDTAVQHNLLLYRDANLNVYAADLYFQLLSKMSMITVHVSDDDMRHEPEIEWTKDESDVSGLCAYHRFPGSAPLSLTFLRQHPVYSRYPFVATANAMRIMFMNTRYDKLRIIKYDV